jgi:hypothetical protein
MRYLVFRWHGERLYMHFEILNLLTDANNEIAKALEAFAERFDITNDWRSIHVEILTVHEENK